MRSAAERKGEEAERNAEVERITGWNAEWSGAERRGAEPQAGRPAGQCHSIDEWLETRGESDATQLN